MGSIFIGGIIVLVAILAIRIIIKDKKNGSSCTGSCAGCKGKCQH